MKKYVFKKKHLYFFIPVICLVILAVIYVASLLTYRSERCLMARMLIVGEPTTDAKAGCRISFINSHTNMISEMAVALRVPGLCNLTLGYENSVYTDPPVYTAQLCRINYDVRINGIAACANYTILDYDSCLIYVANNPKSEEECKELGKADSQYASTEQEVCYRNLGKPVNFHLKP